MVGTPDSDALSEQAMGRVSAVNRTDLQRLLTPPHPNKKGVFLQLGENKRGTLVYFEPVSGEESPSAWRYYRDCYDQEIDQIRGLDGTGKLVSKPGPGGNHLIDFER